MKKLLRSTFGTLVVAAFLAMTPPAYARGGHGGGHSKHRGGHGGHGGGNAAVAHVKGGHHGFGIRGGRSHARRAGRAYYATRGGHWGGYGYSRYSLGYYGLGYGYPYYGYYRHRSGWYSDPYYGYYPFGYYPYRYEYWPSVGFSFGFSGY